MRRYRRSVFRRALLLCGSWLLLWICLACSSDSPESQAPANPAAPEKSLAGIWRAVLTSPGGELPFTLRVTEGEEGELAAAVENGTEEALFSAVVRQGNHVELRFDWYDSEITATLDESGDRLTGAWRRTGVAGDSTLPFSAERAATNVHRFAPVAGADEAAAAAVPKVEGVWSVVFHDAEGDQPARGEFVQKGKDVTGTFLTPTGDHRFLAGSYEDGLLRLSTFDGAHAFLFHARAQADGSLSGDFWSRDAYHATWTAERTDGAAEILPDAWSLVGLANQDERLRFAFPDLDGSMVTHEDPRFAGKVVLVNLFGSWCPNCNDEAPLLAEWHRRYHERGLEIVGLAYELTGDAARDRELVQRFAERYRIPYPLLLAGVSDKARAAASLPDLQSVVAFPTNIFIGRDGKVRKIHSGWSGPGTGQHHQELVAELEGLLEELLTEPA